MLNYQQLIKKVLLHGVAKQDRTGTGTWSIHGEQMKFNLGKGFPATTTKRLWTKGVWVELLWFLSGDTRADFLREHDVGIWEEWTPPSGDLGPVYGAQWRNFNGIDQLKKAVEMLRTDPFSRRILVSAWNPNDLDKMALPPCHYSFQFIVRDGFGGRFLDTVVIMRSVDVFLGLPFDIASYATLTHMVARCVGMIPGELTMQLGDVHLYRNHGAQAKELLKRKPVALPVLRELPLVKWPWEYKLGDLSLSHYNPLPTIKAPISI